MKKTGCLIIFLLIACFSGRAWCWPVAGPLTKKSVVKRIHKTGTLKAPKAPSAMLSKPDPNRINATAEKFFHVTDPQIETQAYGRCLTTCQRRGGGFVLAYEAVTDRVRGGHVQGLVVFLTHTLRQCGPVNIVNPKAGTSVLRSMSLHEFRNGRVLLVFRKKSETDSRNSAIYYVIYKKNGRRLSPPAKITGESANLDLIGVTMMPGKKAAMITFARDDQAYVQIIGADGRSLIAAKKLENVPISGRRNTYCKTPLVTVPPEDYGQDRLLLPLSCDGASGLMHLDFYGQWIGGFRIFHKKQVSPLKRKILNLLPLPGVARYLLLLEGHAMVIMNEPRSSSAVHQFSNEIPITGKSHHLFVRGRDRELICYNQQNASSDYSVHARVIDNIGQTKKRDQVVLTHTYLVSMIRLRNNDILIIGTTTRAGIFKYILIR